MNIFDSLNYIPHDLTLEEALAKPVEYFEEFIFDQIRR
jgi:hypothetical protein